MVAGALGWYFDTPQLHVVIDKFWAYADVNYRLDGRKLGDFTTYPIFNKYGSINLGEVAGGVRLFWTESVAGVINWSLAAPLFSINYVLLDAALQAKLAPDQDASQSGRRRRPGGAGGARVALGPVDGAGHQFVPAPVAGPDLVQSGRRDPHGRRHRRRTSRRTRRISGSSASPCSPAFSPMTGCRVLIWFDHMGLRVATLVNLSFLGGDRADEAAARFVGHHGRTRAIPDGIRRFGTWAPLLIPFYIPRGPEWDKAWTGAEALARGGAPMPDAVRTLAFAYAASGAAIAAASSRPFSKSAPKSAQRGHGSMARRSNSRDGRTASPSTTALWGSRFSATAGARLSSWARSAAASRSTFFAGRSILCQARGHFFYVSEEGEAPWSIGFEPARRAGDYRIEEPGFNRLAIVNALNGIEARMEIAPDPEGAILSWRIRLENKSDRPRRLRLTSFCEVAGHETGAYAKDLDFAGMHVETVFVRASQRHSRAQPALALGARRSRRNRVLRGQAGAWRRTRRLRGFAHPLHRRRLADEANRLRAVALAQARRRRQALALRPGGEFHPRGDARRPARQRRRNSSSAAPTTPCGRAN